ncbi:MAG: hypothetical protein ACE5H2_01190 [Terriglobia bacterium]
MATGKQTRCALLLAFALLANGVWASLSSQETGEKEKEKAKAEETSKKKKKKKKSTPGSEPGSRELSTRKVLSRVLRSYKTGLESLSVSSVSNWIDPQRFHDYPRFEEGVTVFLQSLGELRLFTREVSVQVEGDRAVMIVDAEMIFAQRDTPGPPARRTSQITFDFQRTPRGWKITEINPRSFFLP